MLNRLRVKLGAKQKESDTAQKKVSFKKITESLSRYPKEETYSGSENPIFIVNDSEEKV